MARSALMPLRIGDHGGMAWTPSDDGGARSLEQVVVARLTPGTTQHPFDLADGYVTPGISYEVAGPRQGVRHRQHITEAFAALEADGRARLVDVKAFRVGDDGKAVIDVHWQNLELGGVPQRLSSEE